jgi:hypothetical protein
MRVLALAIFVIGCRHDDPPAREAPLAPHVESVAARPTPADAPAADAVDPDAAGGDSPDYSFYDDEAIGPLRAKMSDKELIAVLGKPRAKQAPSEEAATGAWVSSWRWAGASALMVADTKQGPWHARDVSVTASASYATKRGIHVGSTRAEAERLYPRSPDDQQQDPNVYVVGSVYGGMLFTFEHDRVVAISLGVFAF